MATSSSMSGYFDSPASSSSRLAHSRYLSPQTQSSARLSPTGTPKHTPYHSGATGHAGNGHNHSPGSVFSLAHPHERIQVPVPPSLRLRKPSSPNHKSTTNISHSAPGVWYDNDEFNGHVMGVGSSSLHLDLDGHNHQRYMEDAASDHSSGLLSRPSLIHSDSTESNSSSGSSNGTGFYPLSSHGSPYPTSRPLPIANTHHFNHLGHSGHSTPSVSPTASPGPQGLKSLPPFLVLPLPTH